MLVWQPILCGKQQMHHAQMIRMISEDIGPIFTKFSALVEKWIPDIRFHRLRDVAMVTNFRSKLSKIAASFFTWSRIISGFSDQFEQSLHHMVDIKWQMISPTLFFRYLKGCCHGN